MTQIAADRNSMFPEIASSTCKDVVIMEITPDKVENGALEESKTIFKPFDVSI